MGINYHHLRYFWMVARSGGVGRAAVHLHLTPQTLSGQIRLLEHSLGTTLFRKVGRGLELTDDGRLTLQFADTIFSLGGELEDAIRRAPGTERQLRFRVGVTDAVPKTVACRLLEPALRLSMPVRIVNRTGKMDALLLELALLRIDLVLADAAIPPGANVRAYSHALGRSGMTFFATSRLCRQTRRRFPKNLQDLPMLMPGPDTAVAGRLRRWLDSRALAPRVAGEFDDSALMKAFGQQGLGVFAAPTALARDVERRYGVQSLGATDDVYEEFFALSIERRIKHPCVAAIAKAASAAVFN